LARTTSTALAAARQGKIAGVVRAIVLAAATRQVREIIDGNGFGAIVARRCELRAACQGRVADRTSDGKATWPADFALDLADIPAGYR
jgi:hypothetical protein